jgi:DNA (cytosine-5)-methyltransferase 1
MLDQAFLRCRERHEPSRTGVALRAVDLFAGCGGMSIGLEHAAHMAGRSLQVRLAVDLDPTAIMVYKANIQTSHALSGDVAAIFDGQLGSRASKSERQVRARTGSIDVLLGGPPCQGHSDLNNHTRRRDPKNALYLRMARAAEILSPKVVVIENVAPVQWDESGVVESASSALTDAGYQVAGQVVDLRRVGVPQRRRRYLLVGSSVQQLDAPSILQGLVTAMPNHPDRTVRWAIRDLLDVNPVTPYDTPSRVSQKNAQRMAYLFDKNCYDLPNRKRPKCHRHGRHSYVSMYGRLKWDEPAQTITTGFGSMGQGRYVHPARPRTITPHEAARLQTFPDWFDFGEATGRSALGEMIGNAVPPFLMFALGKEIIRGLSATEAESRLRHA